MSFLGEEKINDVIEIEKNIVRADGKVRVIHLKGEIIRDNSGKPIKSIGMVHDITKIKMAEEAVRQTKHNYETFFSNIDDFLYVLDMQGKVLQINNTVIRRLGYSREELIGQSVLMVHPPELREEAARIVQDMMAGKKVFCPIPVMAKGGQLIPVETKVTKGEWDGKPVLFGASKDISQLKLSEAKFSQAFHANAVLMALSKETGEFIDVNEVFLEKLGFSKDEVIGKTAIELNIFAVPEERNRALAILHETGRVRNLDIKIRMKNGAIRSGLFSFDYITIGETARSCILTTMVDITERIKVRA